MRVSSSPETRVRSSNDHASTPVDTPRSQARPAPSGEGPLGSLQGRTASVSRGNSLGPRAGLPAAEQSVSFGGPRHSRSSATGYRNSKGVPCDSRGNPVVMRDQYSPSGYATANGRPCDRDGYGTQQPQQSAPSQTTPFHAGTQNDCGLHTIAALTGWTEQQVVQGLGLSQQQVQHIANHGMQPADVTAALGRINNGNVSHRQGSPRTLAASLPQLPDGHQFAMGMQRNAGIGHLVAGQRVGNQLVVTDRQTGQQMAFNSEQDLHNYLSQNGVSQVHTWYNQ